MNNYFSEDFQYDSCVTRGICSMSPKNSALQTVIVLYLRICAKYLIKIIEKEEIEEQLKTFILNTLSSTVYNPEISESTFNFALQKFRKEIPKIMDKYTEHYPDNDLEDERKKVFELFDETQNIISAIKYGEYIFNRTQEQIEISIRDLYTILLIISKNLSVKLLDLMSYGNFYDEAFLVIIQILDSINLKDKDKKKLFELSEKSADIDMKTSKILRDLQEEHFGTQTIAEVSYTTYPNKAILVVGSEIKELENILIAFKDSDIDIYTHDEMMLAHTFPKFSEYKNLRGQYGQGVENCLLDFATFPGPIILTKHSLHNIENFYRGRLFTTDYTSPKGIIKIDNNDFSKIFDSIEESKGFKTGKECETVSIGYDFEEIIQEIYNKIDSGKYNRIFIIGLDVYSLEQKSYFEKIIAHVPDDILIISFSYKTEKKSIIHINSCFDTYSIVKIYDYIKNFDLPIDIFIPKCNRESLSQMLYFNSFRNTRVYVGKCIPMILKPSLLKTLGEIFKINFITSAKKDLESILKN